MYTNSPEALGKVTRTLISHTNYGTVAEGSEAARCDRLVPYVETIIISVSSRLVMLALNGSDSAPRSSSTRKPWRLAKHGPATVE